MMPSAPWNGTVRTLRSAASERQISGMVHEIGKVFGSRETHTGRGAIHDGVHGVRERLAPRRHHDDDQDLHDLLRRRHAQDRMQRLGDPGMVRCHANIDAKGVAPTPSSEMLPAPRKNAVQTFAGGPGRSPAAITSHRNKQRGCYRGGTDDGGEGFKQQHLERQLCQFLSALLGSNRSVATASRGRQPASPEVALQQPLQIFFSCAFISASSALMVSTYFAGSILEPGTEASGNCVGRGRRCCRRSLVVAGQPGSGVGNRFAILCLGNGGGVSNCILRRPVIGRPRGRGVCAPPPSGRPDPSASRGLRAAMRARSWTERRRALKSAHCVTVGIPLLAPLDHDVRWG